MHYFRNNIQSYNVNQWNRFYLYDESSPSVEIQQFYWTIQAQQKGPQAVTTDNRLKLYKGVWIVSYNWFASGVSSPNTNSQWYLRAMYVSPANSAEQELYKIGGIVASTGTGGTTSLPILASDTAGYTQLSFEIFVGGNSWLTTSVLKIRAVQLTPRLYL